MKDSAKTREGEGGRVSRWPRQGKRVLVGRFFHEIERRGLMVPPGVGRASKSKYKSPDFSLFR